MDTISFVFQNSRLLKGSILDNVRLGRPQATEMCIRDSYTICGDKDSYVKEHPEYRDENGYRRNK